MLPKSKSGSSFASLHSLPHSKKVTIPTNLYGRHKYMNFVSGVSSMFFNVAPRPASC